jgi:ComF family protein
MKTQCKWNNSLQCTAATRHGLTPTEKTSRQKQAQPDATRFNPQCLAMTHRLRGALTWLAQWLLPSNCLLCGASSMIALCVECSNSLTGRSCPRCKRCGSRMMAVEESQQCGRCLSNPPSFDDSFILADYAAPIDRLVQDLKFRAQLPLASAFGDLLAQGAAGFFSEAEFIVPVPLSHERLEQRGFNQALEIARPVARALRLPLAIDTCVRVRNTSAQASLPLSQRRVNMRGAFAVRDRKLIDGKHVLVVDDVMTTGHTLNELAACLKRHGAKRVSNLVLARTPLR